MPRRYFTSPQRPKAEYYEDESLLPALTVFETDRSPVDTGLVDQSGTPLYAVDEPGPLGFMELKVERANA